MEPHRVKLACSLPFVLAMLGGLIVGCILAADDPHCTKREDYSLVTLNHFRAKNTNYTSWYRGFWDYHKPNVSLVLDRDDAEEWYLPGAIDVGYSRYCHWDREFVYREIHPNYNCTMYDPFNGLPYNAICINYNVTVEKKAIDVTPVLYNYTCQRFNTSLGHHWVNIRGMYRDILNAENPEKENITLAELKIPEMSCKVKTKLDIPLWKQFLLPCILAFVMIPFGAFGCFKATLSHPWTLFFLLLYLLYLQVCIVALIVVFDKVDPSKVATAISAEFVNLVIDTTPRSSTHTYKGFTALFISIVGLVAICVSSLFVGCIV